MYIFTSNLAWSRYLKPVKPVPGVFRLDIKQVNGLSNFKVLSQINGKVGEEDARSRMTVEAELSDGQGTVLAKGTARQVDMAQRKRQDSRL